MKRILGMFSKLMRRPWRGQVAAPVPPPPRPAAPAATPEAAPAAAAPAPRHRPERQGAAQPPPPTRHGRAPQSGSRHRPGPDAGQPAPHHGARRPRSDREAAPGAPHVLHPVHPVPPPARHEGWSVTDYAVAPCAGKTRFHDLGLHDRLLHAVADLGFQYCTPIQAAALPPALQRQDVAGQAQTGTGKTAAFLLTAFQHFLQQPAPEDRRTGAPRLLVIAPTRELVLQIHKDAVDCGKYCPFHNLAVFGGTGYGQQQERLRTRPVDLVAATPGRLLDFARQGILDLGQVEIMVIDEADRMLDMGFIPDVKRIIAKVPPKQKRQTLLFSATLTTDVRRLAAQWMVNPLFIEIEPEHVAAHNVEQIVYMVGSHEKLPLLHHLLTAPGADRVLVFVNRRDEGENLARKLSRRNVNCGLISGDVPQNTRIRILEEFRGGGIPVLVATDVAGRGIHIDNVTHVINYDVPVEPEDYVHRIGRTGRAGAAGIAITLACEQQSFTLPEIEKLLGHQLTYRHPTEEQLRAPENRRSR